MTYKIVRKFLREDQDDEVIEEGLTLLEAQTYCIDPETSYKTCSSKEGQRRTQRQGAWFDAYYPED